MEMRGIEPRAFHMQSERSTTELHPPCSITVFCFYGYPTTSERQTPWGCCNFADSCEHWYWTRLNYYYVAAIYLFFVLSSLPFLLSLIDFSIQRFFFSFFFWFPKSWSILCLRPYHVESTSSRPITEVKQHWVALVLGWVTAWEYAML